MEAFHGFYADLYSEHKLNGPQAVTKFLDNLPIPTLSADHRDRLEAPVSTEEVLAVIKNLKRCSAPGPDGFSAPYYKTFANTLAPYLAKFINSKIKGDPLDPQMNAAFITVIPKPDRDPGELSNYRPISLINNDLKIMTKIMVDRLASLFGSYIDKDQVRFIPGRQGPDQIRRTVDVVSILQSGWDGSGDQKGMLLSLDLQKAFDPVSWSYLFSILDRWGFGPRFSGLLKSLYSNPEARIKLQGQLSEPIKIARGTRQGRPLSPLIFAIAIESLAIAILTNPDITGVRCGPNIHKGGLFADDLILYLTSPVTSLPVVCKLLEDFAKTSGLHVNYSKSQALNVSLSEPLVSRLKDSFRFSWSESSI